MGRLVQGTIIRYTPHTIDTLLICIRYNGDYMSGRLNYCHFANIVFHHDRLTTATVDSVIYVPVLQDAVVDPGFCRFLSDLPH